MASDTRNDLKPTLGLYPTTAIIIGSVIGSGIFVSSAGMARNSTTGWMLLLVWIVGGLMTLMGTLTQCELAGTLPKTGGLYIYLKEAFGEGVGFFYGWANFMIAGSGGIAGIAFVFASYVGQFLPLPHSSPSMQSFAIHLPYLGNLFPFADIGEKGVAILAVIGLTHLNARGVRLGAGLQSASTTLKVLAILFVIGFAFRAPTGSWSHIAAHSTLSGGNWFSIMGLFVIALSGSFWAYDGWGNGNYCAGEVKNPSRTLPLATLIAIFITITVYIGVNIAYLYVFPVSELGSISGDRIAAALMQRSVGPVGAIAVSILILLSAFDTTNSSVLTNARVYFAMAKEKLFFKSVGEVHAAHGTPAMALWVQCFWSVLLLISGSFDLITSMYVFVNWLFYLLMALAVFRLRQRKFTRQFTCPGYPYIPFVFTLFTFFYLVMTLIADIHAYQAGTAPCVKSVMGLLLVLLGAPIYYFMRSPRLALNPAKS